MSLILDALKKSETERKEGSNPSVRVEQAPRDEMPPGLNKRTIAIGAALLLTASGVGIITLMGTDAPLPPQEQKQVAQLAPATPPMAEKPAEKIKEPEPRKEKPVPEKIPPENKPLPSARPDLSMAAKIIVKKPVLGAPGKPVIVKQTPLKATPRQAPKPQVMAAPSVAKPAPKPLKDTEPAPVSELPAPAAPESLLAQIIPPHKPAPPEPLAIERDPEQARQYLKKAEAFEREGQIDQALKAYDRAIELDQNLAEAYFGRGWIHETNRAHETAIRDFSQAIRNRKNFTDAYYARGWAYEQNDAIGQAINDYGHVIRLQPDHLSAALSRGILKFYGNQESDAGRDFVSVQKKGSGALSDFGLLWLYLSRVKSSPAPADVIASFAGTRPQTDWPGILFQAFIGKATAAEVTRAMKTTDSLKTRKRQCVGFFFLGQHRLNLGDRKGAKRYFSKTLETGITSYRQYWAAKIELKRLGEAP